MSSPLLYTRFDWDVAGRTLYGEARGESMEGQIAIAWVIRNRVHEGGWWGNGIVDVCQKKLQFSCWNPGDPTRDTMLAVTLDSVVFRRCLAFVTLVFSGDCPDPTDRATNYFTIASPVWAKIWPPEWAARMKETRRIGAHVFYRNFLPEERA